MICGKMNIITIIFTRVCSVVFVCTHQKNDIGKIMINLLTTVSLIVVSTMKTVTLKQIIGKIKMNKKPEQIIISMTCSIPMNTSKTLN